MIFTWKILKINHALYMYLVTQAKKWLQVQV